MDFQNYHGARQQRSMGLATVVVLGLLWATGCDETDGAVVTVTLPESAMLLSPDGVPLDPSERVHFELFVAEQSTTVVDGVRALGRQFDNDVRPPRPFKLQWQCGPAMATSPITTMCLPSAANLRSRR